MNEMITNHIDGNKVFNKGSDTIAEHNVKNAPRHIECIKQLIFRLITSGTEAFRKVSRSRSLGFLRQQEPINL